MTDAGGPTPGAAPAGLCVVIPVRDEPESIGSTLDQLAEHVPRSYAVHVVYDHEEDTTLPVLRERVAASRESLVLVRNRYGKGAAAALRSGLESVSADYALVVMADLSDRLDAVGPMLEMADGGCDVVCGSRYMRGGSQVGGPWLKRMLSRGAGVSLHWLAGVPTHDVTNSFKLYRRVFLESVEVESRGGFEVGMELTLKAFARGCRIGEVPSHWTDRSEGDSKFRLWKWLPLYLRWYAFGLRAGWGRPARMGSDPGST